MAGSGSDLIVGNLFGNDTLVGGSGTATEAGGFGNNLYEWINGQAGGTDVLANFETGNSKLSLQGYAPGEEAAVIASQHNAFGNTTLTLSDDTTIQLLDVSHVTASNFA